MIRARQILLNAQQSGVLLLVVWTSRVQPLDVRRRFSRARDSFDRAQKDRSCKTQLSSG